MTKAIFLILVLFFCGCDDVSFADQSNVLEIARSQLGKGEIGGNNKGKEVKKYTHGQEVAWCAGFVSWCRYKSGQVRGAYFLSALSYWRSARFKHVHNPKAGDLIIFKRGSQQGHVGIVEQVEGGRISTIEGNVGKFPATVKRLHYNLGSIPHLLGFVRLN